MTLKDLDKATAEIRALLKRARKLSWSILDALAPSPYKHTLEHFGQTNPMNRRT